MTPPPDFIAYGADGRALIVETKVRPATGNNAAWSLGYRENLIANDVVPVDAWLLLATPETLFLWQPTAPPDAEANWETDARPVFAPYLSGAGIDAGSRLDGQAFEMVVAFWLRDLQLGDSVATGNALLDKVRERLRTGSVVRGKTAA
jgi:hypothetical protein